MRSLSQQGVTVSDVTVDHGAAQTYSRRQARMQLRRREGKVFDQLCNVNRLYTDDNPNLAQAYLHYKVTKDGSTHQSK